MFSFFYVVFLMIKRVHVNFIDPKPLGVKVSLSLAHLVMSVKTLVGKKTFRKRENRTADFYV